ncbi:hypothetical protein KL86DPRO_50003 [uncultured delta proteobacterium]|uniref:Uncharacterized protein n=1 Tax=uncultured delta proteobacterium TaxID=34034 RepID=A0A212KAY0_9DELT|nr:hypothetical protein KL86DPRO_50003 [uncultured delta proteobacterium]
MKAPAWMPQGGGLPFTGLRGAGLRPPELAAVARAAGAEVQYGDADAGGRGIILPNGFLRHMCCRARIFRSSRPGRPEIVVRVS